MLSVPISDSIESDIAEKLAVVTGKHGRSELRRPRTNEEASTSKLSFETEINLLRKWGVRFGGLRLRVGWWSWGDSNPLPPPCKGGALPDELQPPVRIAMGPS